MSESLEKMKALAAELEELDSQGAPNLHTRECADLSEKTKELDRIMAELVSARDAGEEYKDVRHEML